MLGLLIYIVEWYWNWLEYQVFYRTNNIADPAVKLKESLNKSLRLGKI